MNEHALSAWAQVLEVARPEAVTRVGVRYTNRIPRASASDRAGDWLVPGEFLPPGVLSAPAGTGQGPIPPRFPVHPFPGPTSARPGNVPSTIFPSWISTVPPTSK